jgi:putative membrane protein
MTDERKEWLARAPQEALAKKLGVVAWLITAVVLILVGLMRRPELQIHLPAGVSLAFLPAFNAAMNTLAALSLIGALVAVKQGRISLHRRFIFTAMGLSVLFLLSYVVYHFTSADVIYGDANLNGSLDAVERAAVAGSRPTYLSLLISHIVLAGLSLPFILFTFIAGFTNRLVVHRRLARWVFPLWLYVAMTGPICYWMLRPYYS